MPAALIQNGHAWALGDDEGIVRQLLAWLKDSEYSQDIEGLIVIERGRDGEGRQRGYCVTEAGASEVVIERPNRTRFRLIDGRGEPAA